MTQQHAFRPNQPMSNPPLDLTRPPPPPTTPASEEDWDMFNNWTRTARMDGAEGRGAEGSIAALL
ncbi:MAG: hypothetical protein ACREBR_01400 [bacterium]